VILEPFKETSWPEGFWDDFSYDPDFGTPAPLPSEPVVLD